MPNGDSRTQPIGSGGRPSRRPRRRLRRHPAAVDVALGERRSEVLDSADLPKAIQQVHCQIHRALTAYQTVAEQRRHLAAEIGELVRQLVDALLAAGWTEEQARNTNVHELATHKPATHRRT